MSSLPDSGCLRRDRIISEYRKTVVSSDFTGDTAVFLVTGEDNNRSFLKNFPNRGVCARMSYSMIMQTFTGTSVNSN